MGAYLEYRITWETENGDKFEEHLGQAHFVEVLSAGLVALGRKNVQIFARSVVITSWVLQGD